MHANDVTLFCIIYSTNIKLVRKFLHYRSLCCIVCWLRHFFGVRIWLGTNLGRFSINYFRGLGFRFRVRVGVMVGVRVSVGKFRVSVRVRLLLLLLLCRAAFHCRIIAHWLGLG